MAIWHAFALAATCASAPSGEQIAQALAARAARDSQSTFSAKYQKEWREQNIDDLERPLLNEEKMWRIAGNGYRFTQTLITRDGKRLTRERPELRINDARQKFIARYTLALTSPCSITIGNHRLWVVSFRPRTDVRLPSGDEEDELLNRMSGTMFIDVDGGYVRYAYGTLSTPFTVGLILGKVLSAKIWMEQDDADGVVILQHVSADIEVKVLFDGRRYIRRIYQVFRQSAIQPQLTPLP